MSSAKLACLTPEFLTHSKVFWSGMHSYGVGGLVDGYHMNFLSVVRELVRLLIASGRYRGTQVPVGRTQRWVLTCLTGKILVRHAYADVIVRPRITQLDRSQLTTIERLYSLTHSPLTTPSFIYPDFKTIQDTLRPLQIASSHHDVTSSSSRSGP